MKEILILGGTNFIGRVLVEKLLEIPEFKITLYNRGKRNPGLFPDVKRIVGDRETDSYSSIIEQNWDCIIDLSGYYPESFSRLLKTVKEKVNRYIFVSTLSVYDFEKIAGKEISESSPTLSCNAEQAVSKLPDAYGEKKAEMERMLLASAISSKIVIRPSYVYGHYDFTDRHYHWLWRGKMQDKILIPDTLFDFALTEVHDLASSIIKAIDFENPQQIYNAVTHNNYSISRIIEDGAALSGNRPNLVRADNTLSNSGKFPLHVPYSFNVNAGIWKRDLSKAHDVSPISASLVDYYNSLGWPEPKSGFSYSEEKLHL